MATSAGSADNAGRRMLYLWDLKTRKRIHQIPVLKGNISCLAFSPDGKSLASSGWSTLAGYSADGRNLKSRDFRDSLQLWNVATGTVIRKFPGDPDSRGRGQRRVQNVAFSRDGKFLISGEHDGTIVVYEAATGTVWNKLTGHQGEIRGLDFSAGGRFLASLSMDMTALVWDFPKIID